MDYEHIPLRLFRPYTNADGMQDSVARACASAYLGEGPRVIEFETALRAHLHAEYVLAVNSGTAALWLALWMLAQRGYRHVITTPLCCLASTETLLHLGLEPVWADVDYNTGNIDPGSVEDRLNTVGPCPILSVDWGGTPCDYDTLTRLAGTWNVPLVRDAAHYFGPLHPLVDFTCLSFQAIKHLTTGDGGALVCRDPAAYKRAKAARWFGLNRDDGASMRCYQRIAEPGFKFHMNDIAAGFGLANLPGIDSRIGLHRANAAHYDALFAGSTVVQPFTRTADSACWLYTVRVPHARLFSETMALDGIETSQVHARNDTQPIFAGLRRFLPAMNLLEEQLICLPVGWWVMPADVARVAEAALRYAR